MKYRLYEKTYDSLTVDENGAFEWIDVGSLGGNSLVATVVASGGSSPTDSDLQFEGALAEDKSDAVLVGTAVTAESDAVFVVSVDQPPLRYYRLKYAIASGSYVARARVLVKGDKAG